LQDVQLLMKQDQSETYNSSKLILNSSTKNLLLV